LFHGGAVSQAIAQEIIVELRRGWPTAEVVPDPQQIAQLERQLGQHAELVAVAVAGGADTLLARNPGDYPDAVCAPFHVFSRSPDRFIRGIFRGDPDRTIQLLARQVAGDSQGISFREFLGGLASAGLEQFVYDLLGFRSVIELEALADDWRKQLENEWWD
jgi:hypothetical protein